MASIVAYIELREGAITRPSRFVVAEARRIADSAGATVFALLTVGPLAQIQMDRLASEISAAGADRILCSSSDALGEPALDATHGALLAQVAEHLRPVLFLFPAGGTGVQLGPPLAVRIGAAYMANASIAVSAEGREPAPDSQRVILSKWRAARDGLRKIDVGDLERPVVASLISGSFPPPAGQPYAEVEMVPCPDAKFPEARVIDSELDPAAEIELCAAVVWSGRSGESAKAALRTELPASACLVTVDEAESPAPAAVPQHCFVLPSAHSSLTVPLPWMASQSLLTRVDHDPACGTQSRDADDGAATADADLAEFAAALRRARGQEEAS
ncbi:MAG TPA: hypothetical protein VF524_11505 [Polyangia bacterium]